MLIRPFEESDAPMVLDILTDCRVSETYMLPDFAAREDAFPLFQRLLALSREEKRFVRAIVTDGICVGFLNDVEITGDSIELGYVIHPEHWGKGYAADALKEAIRQLFDRGFRQVIAGAFQENAASTRVMEKAGMTRLDREDTVEYRGILHRCMYYGITQE